MNKISFPLPLLSFLLLEMKGFDVMLYVMEYFIVMRMKKSVTG
jgi:hypothetical protein